jgi:peptidoglycan/xylan/chitin deacetylase (PgdA/CDA1 family)/2-polyprenyl-3-methyl-5-hydroxy-6-metoxy-1,4-benzoquinol methylase
VSVVVPAWRAEATVRETLLSLQGQREPNWEAVVVDDGSDDGTAQLVASLASRDPRIRLVREQHGGVSRARNAGIARARAEWLLFLDADDLLDPGALGALLAAITPDVDLVMGEYVRVAPSGQRHSGSRLPETDDWFEVLAARCPTAIHACLVRRSVVEDVGCFDTELVTCEDWDLWQRVVRTGGGVAVVHEPVALYRLRHGSAFQDERRFLADARVVMERAHGIDPRVPAPRAEYRSGRPAGELSSRFVLTVCWAAGQAIGAGREGAGLLEVVAGQRLLSLDVGSAADSLVSGLAVHGHGRGWDELANSLHRFVTALAGLTAEPGLVHEMTRRLEDAVLGWAEKLPATAGATHAVRVALRGEVPDVELPAGAFLLRVEVADGDERLGVVTVPAFHGVVRGLVIADAVAAELSWALLGHHFAATVYAEGTDHDAEGWLTLLRELWGRPEWSEADFYDDTRQLDEPAELSTDPDPDGWLTVEVGPQVPHVPAWDGDVNVAVAIGGRRVGALTLSARDGLSPQQLRVAISSECGMELCVAAVREGLLSGARGAGLRARLGNAAASNPADVPGDAVLGRHPHGPIDSPASRHASLPAVTAELLGPVLSGTDRSVTWSADRAGTVRYAPDVLGRRPPAPSVSSAAAGADAEPSGRRMGRHAFEALFATSPDPWRYDSEYERTKYSETLEVLGDVVVDRALELGCASGHFTQLLAPRVRQLVAADISSLALAAAQERCRAHRNVEYRQLDLGSEPVPGPFDLIVCSEMLYYASDRPGLPQLTADLAAALRPGGHILTAHAHAVVDGSERPAFDWDNVPFGAAYIGRTFASTPDLHLVRELRTPLYRIQLFRKDTGARRLLGRIRRERPQVHDRPLTAQLTPDVAAHVRWEGDESVRPAPASTATTSALPILMYHRIASSGPEALGRYRVSPAMFEEHLDYLRATGFRGVTLDEWATARRLNTPLPGRAVLVTFDDAYVDFGDVAWPLLQRYGFPATLFVPTAHVGGDSAWDERFGATAPLLDWDRLRELSAAGLCIGAHGHTHRPLPGLTPTEVADETARSRVQLQDELGIAVTAVASPYGRQDAVVTHLQAACGFLHGVTTRSALSSLRDRALALPRLEVTGGDDVPALIRKLGPGA